MGLFPNDIAKEKVINLLEKEPVLELDDVKEP